jgi:preprotein translocase subunit YajC
MVKTMIDRLLEMALPYGIFALLFVWLLYTTNSRNERREKEYQKTITKNQEVIVEQAKAFTHMSSDIKEIKGMVIKIKDRGK